MEEKREYKEILFNFADAESAGLLLQIQQLNRKMYGEEKLDKKLTDSRKEGFECGDEEKFQEQSQLKEKIECKSFEVDVEKKSTLLREPKNLSSFFQQFIQSPPKTQLQSNSLSSNKIKIEESIQEKHFCSGSDSVMKKGEKLNSSFEDISKSLEEFLIADEPSQHEESSQEQSTQQINLIQAEVISEENNKLHSCFPSSLLFTLDHADSQKMHKFPYGMKESINTISFNDCSKIGKKLIKRKAKILLINKLTKRCQAQLRFMGNRKTVKNMMRAKKQKNIPQISIDYCPKLEVKEASDKNISNSSVEVEEVEKTEKY